MYKYDDDDDDDDEDEDEGGDEDEDDDDDEYYYYYYYYYYILIKYWLTMKNHSTSASLQWSFTMFVSLLYQRCRQGAHRRSCPSRRRKQPLGPRHVNFKRPKNVIFMGFICETWGLYGILMGFTYGKR